MRNPVITFKQLASRITGVSLPIFGMSWEPPVSEREIVRSLLVFLEDRRAFHHHHWVEVEHEVVDSVQLVRAELTRALQQLPEDSKAVPFLKSMRAACREYLDAIGPRREHYGRFEHVAELGRLRTIIGTNVAYLAVQFGIDVGGELGRVIPPELRDNSYLSE